MSIKETLEACFIEAPIAIVWLGWEGLKLIGRMILELPTACWNFIKGLTFAILYIIKTAVLFPFKFIAQLLGNYFNFTLKTIEMVAMLSIIILSATQVIALPLIITAFVAYEIKNLYFHLKNYEPHLHSLIVFTVLEFGAYVTLFSLFLTSVLAPTVLAIAVLGSVTLALDLIRNAVSYFNVPDWVDDTLEARLIKLSYLGGSFFLKLAVLLSVLSLVTNIGFGFIFITLATSAPLFIYSQLHEYLFRRDKAKDTACNKLDDDLNESLANCLLRPNLENRYMIREAVDGKEPIELNEAKSMNVRSSTEDGTRKSFFAKLCGKNDSSARAAEYAVVSQSENGSPTPGAPESRNWCSAALLSCCGLFGGQTQRQPAKKVSHFIGEEEENTAPTPTSDSNGLGF